MAFQPLFVRSENNFDRDQNSDLTALLCEDVSLAQQQFAEEADINTIVKRFGLTGELPTVPHPPTYADFGDVMDFQSAQNAIIAATQGFMAFPAPLRAQFDNDPQRMIEFLSDPANRKEAESLGLVTKKTPQADLAPPAPPDAGKPAEKEAAPKP